MDNRFFEDEDIARAALGYERHIRALIPSAERAIPADAVRLPEQPPEEANIRRGERRVGTQQRQEVELRLNQVFAEGYLTESEHQARTQAAQAAVTKGDLEILTSDLELPKPKPKSAPEPEPKRTAIKRYKASKPAQVAVAAILLFFTLAGTILTPLFTLSSSNEVIGAIGAAGFVAGMVATGLSFAYLVHSLDK